LSGLACSHSIAAPIGSVTCSRRAANPKTNAGDPPAVQNGADWAAAIDALFVASMKTAHATADRMRIRCIRGLPKEIRVLGRATFDEQAAKAFHDSEDSRAGSSRICHAVVSLWLSMLHHLRYLLERPGVDVIPSNCLTPRPATPAVPDATALAASAAL
jgi:hypothetical protein